MDGRKVNFDKSFVQDVCDLPSSFYSANLYSEALTLHSSS